MNVTINEDETITSTDDGNDSTSGLQFGNAEARYEPAENEVHAQCRATLVGVGLNAWARVWSEIEVEESNGGDSASKADFAITGEYDGLVNSLGAAASDMWVDLFVRDLSNNVELNNSNVIHGSSKVIGHKTKADSFDRTVASSNDLEAGNRYAVGVRAKTTAVASANPITGLINTASADLHTIDYQYDYLQHTGFGRIDEIDVQWK